MLRFPVFVRRRGQLVAEATDCEAISCNSEITCPCIGGQIIGKPPSKATIRPPWGTDSVQMDLKQQHFFASVMKSSWKKLISNFSSVLTCFQIIRLAVSL